MPRRTQRFISGLAKGRKKTKSTTPPIPKDTDSLRKKILAGSGLATAAGVGILGHGIYTAKPGEKRYSDGAIDLVSGGASGLAATASTYPLDTIATQAQAQARAQGKGLYAGFGPKMLKGIPTSIIGFSTYGATRRKLEEWQKKDKPPKTTLPDWYPHSYHNVVREDMKKTAFIAPLMQGARNVGRFLGGFTGTSRKFTKASVTGMGGAGLAHTFGRQKPQGPLQDMVSRKGPNIGLDTKRLNQIR